MKFLLLAALIAVCSSCNSGDKKNNDGPTTDTTAPPPPPATDPPGVEMKPAGKIDIESFGDVRIGQPSAETLKAMGEPDKRSNAEEWGADGMMHEDWTWKSKGLVLNMSSEKGKSSSMTVFSITAHGTCPFKTKAGMGIGNSYDEVQAAYSRDINKEESSREQITVGSVYGGIIFTLEKDKITRVFLGAAAE